MAGIDTDGPGYRKITIAPQPEEGLTFAKAHYDSINGLISSEWHKQGSGLTLKVSVPPNTTALVRVPAAETAVITEGGGPAEKANGVSLQRREKDAAYYEVGSGSYFFHVR